jgi:hypothetical protein
MSILRNSFGLLFLLGTGITAASAGESSAVTTAEFEIPASGANGAILSQGGRFGGWSLYVKDGKPAYSYNFLGLARYTVSPRPSRSTSPMTATE